MLALEVLDEVCVALALIEEVLSTYSRDLRDRAVEQIRDGRVRVQGEFGDLVEVGAKTQLEDELRQQVRWRRWVLGHLGQVGRDGSKEEKR